MGRSNSKLQKVETSWSKSDVSGQIPATYGSVADGQKAGVYVLEVEDSGLSLRDPIASAIHCHPHLGLLRL